MRIEHELSKPIFKRVSSRAEADILLCVGDLILPFWKLELLYLGVPKWSTGNPERKVRECPSFLPINRGKGGGGGGRAMFDSSFTPIRVQK